MEMEIMKKNQINFSMGEWRNNNNLEMRRKCHNSVSTICINKSEPLNWYRKVFGI